MLLELYMPTGISTASKFDTSLLISIEIFTTYIAFYSLKTKPYETWPVFRQTGKQINTGRQNKKLFMRSSCNNDSSVVMMYVEYTSSSI